MQESGILNIYQTNIYQHLCFMFRVRNETIPSHILSKFEYLDHNYPTSYSRLAFKLPKRVSKYSKQSISYRGPYLWNSILESSLKEEESMTIFQTNIKKKLFFELNEMKFY